MRSFLRVGTINPTPQQSPCSALALALLRRIFALLSNTADTHQSSPPETRLWTSIAAISSGLPAAGVAGALAMPTDARARRAADIGARARRHAIWRAARQPPTIRPGFCSARSTRPRGRRFRSRCRRAFTAPGCCACKTARNWSEYAGANQTGLQRRRLDVSGRRRGPASALSTSRSMVAALRWPGTGAASCIASAGRDIRITDCEILGSGGNGIWLEQVSGDISGNNHHRHRFHRYCLVRRAGPDGFTQQHCRHQRQRHRNPAYRDRRRRHPGCSDNRIEDIKAGPGGSGQYGNAINIRQRHQRIPRRAT